MAERTGLKAPYYYRSLDFEEEWLLDRTEEAERDALAAADAPERDAWFAAISGRPWPPAPIVPATAPAPRGADRDAPPPAVAAHGPIAAGYVDSHDPADPFSADFDPDFDPDDGAATIVPTPRRASPHGARRVRLRRRRRRSPRR